MSNLQTACHGYIYVHFPNLQVREKHTASDDVTRSIHEYLFLDTEILLLARVQEFQDRDVEGLFNFTAKAQVDQWLKASGFQHLELTSPWLTILTSIVVSNIKIDAYYIRHSDNSLSSLACLLFVEKNAYLIEVIFRDINTTVEKLFFELEPRFLISTVT